MALWQGGWEQRARGGVAGPRPLEHAAEPPRDNQYQLVEKESGYHGQPPPTGGERGAFYPNCLLLNEQQAGGTRPCAQRPL
jgi:hypothetical protein